MMDKNGERHLNINKNSVFIDAGYEFIRLLESREGFASVHHQGRLKDAIKMLITDPESLPENVFITGNLAEQIQNLLGRGIIFSTEAVLCAYAERYLDDQSLKIQSVGILEISASGHRVLVVSRTGGIEQLRSHPKCGGGTGFNLDRILGKLDLHREEVDDLLVKYLGDTGRESRQALPVRADRCGVFASSATVSDKNVGVPLDHALGVTIKSEVYKVARKIAGSSNVVICCGGIFRWHFARDCLLDFFREDTTNIADIIFDEDHTITLEGMVHLINRIPERRHRSTGALRSMLHQEIPQLPSFRTIKDELVSKRLFKWIPSQPDNQRIDPEAMVLDMSLDVGSTMAKMMLRDIDKDTLVFQSALHNHGDTAETIKGLFRHLREQAGDEIRLRSIGITGSARYQVQKLLSMTYPDLSRDIFTATENDAHAAGSVRLARMLEKEDELPVRCRDRFVVVDIGGEDTKISIVDLQTGKMLDNAMNIKCSAGTGSLMDTLVSLFKYKDIREAHAAAMEAAGAYSIDATCAVFLMENARRMQAGGTPLNEILASCSHAIVENMARSLWPLVDIPGGALVFLHGQTMLSEPLPLAVAYRIQQYTSVPTPCVVPPYPGHRACIGLLSMAQDRPVETSSVSIRLSSFIRMEIQRRVFICQGVACGDPQAACARVRLTCQVNNRTAKVLLGGCTAVNELESRRRRTTVKPIDGTKKIHKLYFDAVPSSSNGAHVTIPTSFSIGEWGIFLVFALQQLGIQTRLDPVQPDDVLRGQQFFNVDTCAPHAGAAGQLARLAEEQRHNGGEHHWILYPVIDTLPVGLGYSKTCTSNQGGVYTAYHFTRNRYPDARILTVNLSLKDMNAVSIAERLYRVLSGPLDWVKRNIKPEDVKTAVEIGWEKLRTARRKVQDKAVSYLREAWEKQCDVAVVCGRHYILDPGIYDSYAGKLLSEKGIYTIPSYIIDTTISDAFQMVYWSNPQRILSILSALRDRRLHKIVSYPPLAEALAPFETVAEESRPRLRPCLVSTFRCGPDSIIQPIIFEMFKDDPILVLQSDGMIKELAHLETRVATLVNLWRQDGFKGHRDENDVFEMEELSSFHCSTVDRDEDVVYVPTMGDNRLVCAALRSWGLMVPENFDPRRFRLSERIIKGRRIVGDAVCGPFAGVFADIMDAWRDFEFHRKDSSSRMFSRRRAAVVAPTGTGPCRQGMYATAHRAFLYRLKREQASDSPASSEPALCLWTAEDEDLYRMNLPEWLHLRGLQSLIMSDMLRSLSYAAMANVSSLNELKHCLADMESLKRKLIERLESSGLNAFQRFISRFGAIGKYFGYGLWNSLGILPLIRDFAAKYHVSPEPTEGRLRIHVDGEVYMRVSSGDELFLIIMDILGFRTFHFDITPVWTYIEYLLTASSSDSETNSSDSMLKLLRYRIARPLYDAANLPLPHPVSGLLGLARDILPSLKPKGELAPYVGEAIFQGRKGTHIFLNVAPESCMVSTMGDALSEAIIRLVARRDFHIIGLFSQNGDFDRHLLENAFLRLMGPERFYSLVDMVQGVVKGVAA